MVFKHAILIVILFFSLRATAQLPSIDSSNYYDYYSVGKSSGSGLVYTNWLRRIEIAPILVEELKAAGYENVYDNQIYSLSNTQKFLLSAYSLNEDLGFVYSDGHSGIPDRKHRRRRSNSHEASGTDFSQRIYRSKGKYEYIPIPKLPANIFMLQEDCYWYQYTNSPDDKSMLVSKEVILNILRQDIRAILAKAPKPKHTD